MNRHIRSTRTRPISVFALGIAMDRRRARAGFTLIEMLVAMAVTLIMMGAVVSLFSLIGDNVSGSRSTIEMVDRLRAAADRLQEDLASLTAVPLTPPLDPSDNRGYFEILEGYQNHSSWLGSPPTLPPPNESWKTLIGDTDDILMFTIRSRGEPFVGRFAGTTFESPLAEVVWFLSSVVPTIPTDYRQERVIATDSSGNQIRTYTLYRRVLLVAPQSAGGGLLPEVTATSQYSLYDISARPHFSGSSVTGYTPNSLADLTKRENRFAHWPITAPGTAPYYGFPYLVVSPTLAAATPFSNYSDKYATLQPFDNASGRVGEDVILTNVVSFDVRVFDPDSLVLNTIPADPSTALVPGEPGYAAVFATLPAPPAPPPSPPLVDRERVCTP